MAKEKLDLRTTFMKLFVKRIIKEAYVSRSKVLPREIVREIEETEKIPLASQVEIQKKIKPHPLKRPPRIPNPLKISQRMPLPHHMSQISKPMSEPLPKTLLENKPSPPSPEIQQSAVNLGKITQFLKDPSVLSVEVPGPGKNVLVNRSGAVQTTPLVLTKDEISTIMDEVSDKTRIPVTTGLFKAAFQDLVLTAVVSEFVGARFMIQKMNPFQQKY